MEQDIAHDDWNQMRRIKFQLKHVSRLLLVGCLCCLDPLGNVAGQTAVGEGSVQGFDAPEKAGIEFQLRALCGDLDGAMLCVYGDTLESRQMVRQYVEFAAAVIDFRNRFLNVYGYEALERFNDPDVEQHSGETSASGSIQIMTSFEIAKMFRSIKTDPQLQRATMIVSDANNMPLLKTGTGWFIDGEAFFADLDETQREQTAKAIKVMSTALTNLKSYIGVSDVSADDIDFELGRYSFALKSRPPADTESRIEQKKSDDLIDGSEEFGMQRMVDFEVQQCVDFIQRFMDEKDDQWYELIHPLVRPVVDRPKLQIQRRRLLARFENVKFDDSLCRVIYQENESCRTIFGTFDSEYGPAVVRMYKLGERFIGFEIQDSDFAFSTLPIVHDFRGVSQNTWPCLAAIQAGDLGSAVDLLSSQTRDLNKRWRQRGEWVESSERLADFLKEADWKLTQAIDIGQQIAWPQSNEDNLVFEVLHSIELVTKDDDLKRWPSNFEYRIVDGRFELNDWNFGSGEMYVAYSDFDQTIHALRAFAAGDSETIIGMLPKSLRNKIDQVIFDAFLQALSRKIGKYEYLFQPEFSHVREFADDSMTGRSFGWVKFEKIDSYVTLDFSHEFLSSFNFNELPNDISEWIRHPKIEEHLIAVSQGLAEQLSTGESHALSLVDEKQRSEMLDLINEIGSSKSMQLSSYQPFPDSSQCRIVWLSEHDNTNVLITVEYQLDPFGKSVSSLGMEIVAQE